jgi:hypothetical protein
LLQYLVLDKKYVTIIKMSCLFNSLSYFIQETSNNIRQKICDYIEQNKSLIEGIETKDIIKYEENNYIEKMRNTNTWGGAIEIQSGCNIWKCKIIVHNRRDKKNTKIEFIPVSGIIENIFELEWTGGHYEPVRK